MDIETVIENLKDILSCELGEKKIYDKDVAHALGISKESLSHHKRKKTIPYEPIVYFCAKRQISINWVLFNQFPKSLEEHTEPFVAIKYLKNLHASAGGGAVVDRFYCTTLYLAKSSLKPFFKTTLPLNRLQALHVKGDSMEPTFYDDDLVLVYKEEDYEYKGDVFIIEDSFGLMLKRLIRSDGGLEIHSDNPNYKPIFLNQYEAETIKVHGRVLGQMLNPLSPN